MKNVKDKNATWKIKNGYAILDELTIYDIDYIDSDEGIISFYQNGKLKACVFKRDIAEAIFYNENDIKTTIFKRFVI